MKKRIIGCLLITSIVLSGCSLWKPKNTEDDRKPMEQNSAEFDWGNYQKAIYQDRTLIKECNANYQKDISAIKQKENKMLDFSDCKFEPIDEVKSVSVLQEQILDVTPEQSVNTIKQWLKDIHKEDINTDKEILQGILQVTEAIKIRQPQAKLCVMGILPRANTEKRIQQINKELRKKLEQNCIYINLSNLLTDKNGIINSSLFSDGLHPNTKGYEKIAEVLKTYLDN